MNSKNIIRGAAAIGSVVLAGAAVMAGTGPAQAASSKCAKTTCIVSISLEPGGFTMGSDVTTLVKTKATLTLSQAGKKVVSVSDKKLSTHHAMTTVDKLTPNSVYAYKLVVKDKKGHKAVRSGSINTLHRQVVVQFETVTVTDDSDATGPGEFKTWSSIPTNNAAYLLSPLKLNSGDTATLNQVFKQADAGPSTLVRTEMFDDDATDKGLPGVYPNDASWNSGSTPIAQWATASTTLNTLTDSNGLQPFSMSVGGPVGFVVHGHYSVTFTD